MRARQRELGVPEALEWVHDLVPELLDVARASGLEVLEAPLMVLRNDAARRPEPPPGITVRLLEPGDRALAASRAVAQVGFGHPGTAPGEAGPAERDAIAAEQPQDALDFTSERIHAGLSATAVAEDAGGPLASGSHLPLDGVSEVVGVATLPSARRRGTDLIFLSAGSEEIARVYGRLGFERVGTACIAEPA